MLKAKISNKQTINKLLEKKKKFSLLVGGGGGGAMTPVAPPTLLTGLYTCTYFLCMYTFVSISIYIFTSF